MPASTAPQRSEPDHVHHPSPALNAGAMALDRAARLFRAIGDVARLRLLARLARGEMCVTALAAAEGEGLSTVSQRLRVLRAENIVVRRREGKHVNYALADRHMMQLVLSALAHAGEVQPGRVTPVVPKGSLAGRRPRSRGRAQAALSEKARPS